MRSLRWLCSSCHDKRTAAQAQAARTGARVCQHCAAEMPPRTGRGRPAAFCSPACRRAARTVEMAYRRRAEAELAIAQDAAAQAAIGQALRDELAEHAEATDRAYAAYRLVSKAAPTAFAEAEHGAASMAASVLDAANVARAVAVRAYRLSR